MRQKGDRQEIEIKLRIESAAQGRRLLRRCGFRVRARRVHEDNIVFDTPDRRLGSSGKLLRLRRAGKVATITFKGPASEGKYKSRPELETVVGDSLLMEEIVGELGYRPVFRYEKYRTEYGRSGSAGIACLDETPIGVFLELEGRPAWIDRCARALGFACSDYITDSYLGLYRLNVGVASPHMDTMVFSQAVAGKARIRKY